MYTYASHNHSFSFKKVQIITQNKHTHTKTTTKKLTTIFLIYIIYKSNIRLPDFQCAKQLDFKTTYENADRSTHKPRQSNLHLYVHAGNIRERGKRGGGGVLSILQLRRSLIEKKEKKKESTVLVSPNTDTEVRIALPRWLS